MKTISLILSLALEMQTVPRPLPRDLAAVAVERTAQSQASGQTAAQANPAPGGGGQIPAIQLEQTNRTQEQERNVTTRDADLRDLLTSLAQSANLNLSMAPDVSGKVTIDLEDASLGEALDAILTPLNLQYRIDGKLLRVFRPVLETRTLTFDYVNTARSMSRSLAASASAGFSGGGGGAAGGGTTGGSSTSISGTETVDVMRDIVAALDLLKSPAGKVVPMKMAGMFFATDTPKNLDAMQLFLGTVQSSVTRQIVIEAKLIEVQLNNQNQAGVNWNAALGNTLTLTSTMAQTSAFQIGIAHKSFNALISTLKTLGTVDVRSAPSISTLNNQPAVIRIGTQDVFFITSTQINQQTGAIVQTTTTPTTINEGIVLDVTPHISDDGVITMSVHPTITERTGAAVSPQGDSVPIIDVRESDNVVRVLDGDTIAIAGLISTRKIQNTTKVPLIGDLPLIGNLFKNNNVESDKTDMVVLLTPRILTLKTALEYTRERVEQQDQLIEDQKRNK